MLLVAFDVEGGDLRYWLRAEIGDQALVDLLLFSLDVLAAFLAQTLDIERCSGGKGEGHLAAFRQIQAPFTGVLTRLGDEILGRGSRHTFRLATDSSVNATSIDHDINREQTIAVSLALERDALLGDALTLP
jgi:hypothetical protein